MDILTPEPTSVYLYYDGSDILLYVGITKRGVRRNHEHDATKTWWQRVHRQEVEHFESRRTAMAREAGLIRAFCPPYNKQHNPNHEESRRAYEQYVALCRDGVTALSSYLASDRRMVLDPHTQAPKVAFRTQIADSHLLGFLETQKGSKPATVYGLGGKGGAAPIRKIEKHGPVMVFHLTRDWRHPIAEAVAALRYDAKVKSIRITGIQARLDHSDPDLCLPKCPKHLQGLPKRVA